jgi:hypothetical protein
MTMILCVVLALVYCGQRYARLYSPIEITTDALLDPIQLPDDFQLSIGQMNSSFLSHQVFHDITLTHQGKTLLHVTTMEASHSLVDNIAVFFGHKAQVDLVLDGVTLNLEQGEANDGSSQVQMDWILSKIEGFIASGHFNIASVLPQKLLGSSFRIGLADGQVEIKGTGYHSRIHLSSLVFFLNETGDITNVQVKGNEGIIGVKDGRAKLDSFNLLWENDKLSLYLQNISFAGTSYAGSLKKLHIAYGLAQPGNVTVEGTGAVASAAGGNIDVSSFSAGLVTNLRDFSVHLKMDDIAFTSSQANATMTDLDLAVSYVDKQLQLVVHKGNKASCTLLGKEHLELGTEDLQLVLLCNGTLPTSLKGTLEKLTFAGSKYDGTAGNLGLEVAGTPVSDKPVMGDGSLLETLRKNYHDLSLQLSGQAAGTIPLLGQKGTCKVNLKASSRNNLTATSVQLKVSDISVPTFSQDAGLSLGYQGTLPLESDKLQMVEADFAYGDSLHIKGVYSISGKSIKDSSFSGVVSLDDFKPMSFGPFLATYAPALHPFITDSTVMWGTLNIQGSLSQGKVVPIDGRINGQLVFNSVAFASSHFNIGMTLDAYMKSDTLTVNTFSLGVLGYRFSYKGSIGFDPMLPRGELRLDTVKDGKNIMSVSFDSSRSGQYSYQVVAPPVPSLLIKGIVDTSTARTVTSSLDLTLDTITYPMSIKFNMDRLSLSIISGAQLNLYASFMGKTHLSLSMDKLPLPFLPTTSISGAFLADYTDKDTWYAGLQDFVFSYNGGDYTFGCSGKLTADSLDFSSISFGRKQADGKLVSYNGTASYHGSPFYKLISTRLQVPYSFLLSLGDGRSQTLELVMDNTDTIHTKLLLDASMLSLGTLFPSLGGTSLNLRIAGETDFRTENSLNGIVDLSNPGQGLSMKSNLSLKAEQCTLSSLSFAKGNSTISDGNISIDLKGRTAAGKMNFASVRKDFPVDQKTSADLGFSAEFGKVDMKSLVGHIRKLSLSDLSGMTAKISIRNVHLLEDAKPFDRQFKLRAEDKVHIPDNTLDIDFSADSMQVSSTYLNGTYHLASETMQFSLKDFASISMEGKADFKGKGNLLLTDIDVPVNLGQLLMHNPVFAFEGSGITGELRIKDFKTSPRYYGTLFLDDFSARTFWTENSLFLFNNLIFVANGTRIAASSVNGNVQRADTHQPVAISGSFSIEMDGWAMKSLDMDLDIADYVPFFLPLIQQNINVRGQFKGNFSYHAADDDYWTRGKLKISNTVATYGLESYPSYIVPSKKGNFDFDITLGPSVSFTYPNSASPIMQATFAQNQQFSFSFASSSKKLSGKGKIDIAQGEFFYFKNNFYIDDGSFAFATDPQTGAFVPQLQFTATYRALDEDSNIVNITLSVPKSPLNDLTMKFTSSPSLAQAQIMALLGQSLTENNSVASLAGAATSMITSLGFFDINGLSELNRNIAKILNLDNFSIRSNIVENLLVRAISFDNTETTYSPMSFYLNNTTINMGKYLSSDAYLQILFNLMASKKKNKLKFLADDLVMDLRISFEETTPLGRISVFTNPQQLSIPDVLDTMGFSVTKTIEFR